MRPLGLEDVFYLSAIIDKMDVRIDVDAISDQISELVKAGNAAKAQSFLGGQIMLILASKIHKAKNEIKEWLASLTGKTLEEITQLSLKESKNLLEDVFKQEGILELFQSAGVGEK